MTDRKPRKQRKPRKPKSHLFEGKVIVINRDLAFMVGYKEAAFLKQLDYRLDQSTNYIDGHYWVYKTLDGYMPHSKDQSWMSELRPVINSVGVLKNIIRKLVRAELILTENYNKMPTDQTLWYTIDYDKLHLLFDVYAECDSDMDIVIELLEDSFDRLFSDYRLDQYGPIEMVELDLSMPEDQIDPMLPEIDDSPKKTPEESPPSPNPAFNILALPDDHQPTPIALGYEDLVGSPNLSVLDDLYALAETLGEQPILTGMRFLKEWNSEIDTFNGSRPSEVKAAVKSRCSYKDIERVSQWFKDYPGEWVWDMMQALVNRKPSKAVWSLPYLEGMLRTYATENAPQASQGDYTPPPTIDLPDHSVDPEQAEKRVDYWERVLEVVDKENDDENE